MSKSAGTLDPVWDDPAAYDPLRHGPPYLPSVRLAMRVRSASVKSMVRQASNELVIEGQALLESMCTDYAQVTMAELAALVAYLRGLAVVHQTHHWQTRGDTYYGDHLLFERLYKAADGEVDGVAERAIGAGSHMLVQPLMQAKHFEWVMKYLYRGAPVNPDPQGLVALSLRAELCFTVFLQLAYQKLDANGNLSLGIDNMLQGIADKHEESLYLLKQRLDHRESAWKTP